MLEDKLSANSKELTDNGTCPEQLGKTVVVVRVDFVGTKM